MNTIRYNPIPGAPAAKPHEMSPYEVILLPQRAIYWAHARTLMIADLHLGKSHTFWASGAPVPDGILDADLSTLDDLLRRTEVVRLMILGDLLHSGIGLTSQLIDTIAAWRARWSAVEFVVVPGNHDRCLDQVARPWDLQIAAPLYIEGAFAFRHDPAPTPGAYTWAGHLHPLIRLSTPRDFLRLPCFWMSPAPHAVAVLPAFSAFTRGMTIRPDRADQVFAIAEGRVVVV